MAIITYTNANDYVKKSNGANSRWRVSQIPKEGSTLRIDDTLVDLVEKIFDAYPSAELSLYSCYRPGDSGQHQYSTAMDLQVNSGSLTYAQIACGLENWSDVKAIGLYNYTASSELAYRHIHVDVRTSSIQKWYQPKKDNSSRVYVTTSGIAAYMQSIGTSQTMRPTIQRNDTGVDVKYSKRAGVDN